jgi:hypothetical protein
MKILITNLENVSKILGITLPLSPYSSFDMCLEACYHDVRHAYRGSSTLLHKIRLSKLECKGGLPRRAYTSRMACQLQELC